MKGRIEKRLEELGIALPETVAPLANYVPYSMAGRLVFISGQICRQAGKIAFSGRVGKDLSPDEGRNAARLCAVNLLGVLRTACGGDLDRVKRCVRIVVYVNSTDDFTDQPLVANGASDFIVEVLGDPGRHSRVAVSSNSLPMNSAAEVEGVFELNS